MRVTVERIDTHLVAVAPGFSAMQMEIGVDPRMVVIRCPRCRQRTERYLTRATSSRSGIDGNAERGRLGPVLQDRSLSGILSSAF